MKKRKETKRLRSRHLVSPERTRNNRKSHEVAAAAKQEAIMSEKKEGNQATYTNSKEENEK